MHKILLISLGMLILYACSTTKHRHSRHTDTAATGSPLEKAQADEFNAWLLGKMTDADENTYSKRCTTDANYSPFCSSVFKRDQYEEKLRNRYAQRPRKASAVSVYPKFKASHVTNWPDLRFATVNSLLRGLRTARPFDLETLRARSLDESKCPNNMAIALAATLEDLLPTKITYSELAEMYSKGAQCLTLQAPDRESMLTRAGILFYADRKPDRALALFEQSAAIPEAFRVRPYYWAYRIATETQRGDLADKYLALMQQEYPFSFHTLIALAEKELDPGKILNVTNRDLKTRSETHTNLNQLIAQVEILQKHEYFKSAARVLEWAISESSSAEPEIKVYLSDLKEDQNDYVGKISLLSDVLYQNPDLISRDTMEKYFPKLYFPIFEKHSQGLDPYLLLALARRESAFNTRAQSQAKARGLMQVTPQTQRGLNLQHDLFDPDSNVFVGSRYLSDLLKRVNGHIHMALAAYNAGPHRLDVWVKRYPVHDPILFTDLIPFRETREYVAAVLRNYYWYHRIHEDKNSPPGTLFQIRMEASTE